VAVAAVLWVLEAQEGLEEQVVVALVLTERRF
jgi:hypothetical protein